MEKLYYVLVSTVVFTILFYHEGLGVNLALFGLVLMGLIYNSLRGSLTNISQGVLFLCTLVSCIAFAWYGDFASFVALCLSLIGLQFKSQEPNLKMVQAIPLVVLNGIATFGRVFMFKQYLPYQKFRGNLLKILIAYFLIPAIFLGLFTVVYSFGSNHFSALFADFYLDVNVGELIVLFVLGFYISFTFWNYWIPQISYDKNYLLDNTFNGYYSGDRKSFSFFDSEFERKSGVITMSLLNLLLLIFVAVYNYEQFFEPAREANLSSDTHQRVNAVIVSTFMAMGVILFYFKGTFNFDSRADKLKNLTKIWIVLNAVLVLSSMIKTTEYVLFFGLTYKRLGVFAFLILALIGLVLSYVKVNYQKTNAFLFNHMIWYLYGTILLCGFVNWGNLITHYNIMVGKGVEPEFLKNLNYNEEFRQQYFPDSLLKSKKDFYKNKDIEKEQNKSFLSKALYYEFLEIEK